MRRESAIDGKLAAAEPKGSNQGIAQILTLSDALGAAEEHGNSTPFDGIATPDHNLTNHTLLVTSKREYYSFPNGAITGRLDLGRGTTRVWVRNGVLAFRASLFLVGGHVEEFSVGMEHIAPPPPTHEAGMPEAGTEGELAQAAFVGPSLAAVAANWHNSCAGGDRYANNCAHFLSDAFIRAGYSELATSEPHIHARCGTSAHRPIRARDMWAWFQSRASRTSRQIQRNTGWWAIFQLKESVYWGGHVVLLDSNAWKHYGTGWYEGWDQYLYQW